MVVILSSEDTFITDSPILISYAERMGWRVGRKTDNIQFNTNYQERTGSVSFLNMEFDFEWEMTKEKNVFDYHVLESNDFPEEIKKDLECYIESEMFSEQAYASQELDSIEDYMNDLKFHAGRGD